MNASQEAMSTDARRVLEHLPEYLPDYHVAGGKKVPFEGPSLELADAVPQELSPSRSYLFLNGEGEGDAGTVRLATPSASEFKPSSPGGRMVPFPEAKAERTRIRMPSSIPCCRGVRWRWPVRAWTAGHKRSPAWRPEKQQMHRLGRFRRP